MARYFTEASDLIEAFSSPDKYYGLAGNDTFHLQGIGLSGTYDMIGGQGDDRYIFKIAENAGAGALQSGFNGDAGYDTAELDFSSSLRSVGETYYGGTDSHHYVFRASNEILSVIHIGYDVERLVVKGSTFDDWFFGAPGDDWLDGSSGTDTYVGSLGNDAYVFDEIGETVVDEGIGMGTDAIWSSVSVDLRQHSFVENIRLTGDLAGINGRGNGLDNLITGNGGSNVIAGGAGIDTLYGKGGADTFSFAEKGAANADKIWDFDADDKISLDRSIFTGLAIDNGHVAASAFALNKASGNAAQVIYNANTGILLYDANGAGAGGAEEIAYIGKKFAFFDCADILLS